MSDSLVDQFETSVLTYLFTTNTPSPARPTAWYIGLHTSAPTDNTESGEVSGNGYARQSAAFTVSGNQATNSATINFPAATGNQGTITHASVHSASSGTGNMIAYAALSNSKTIETNDVLQLAASQLTITLT